MKRLLRAQRPHSTSVFLPCALALAACVPASRNPDDASHPVSQTAKPDYPGTLRTPSLLTENFQWRQQITATWKTGSRGFDAVLSKDGNLMRLIGLNPMGMPGFVIQLADTTISLENQSGQEMPFPPRYVLLDVQRAFFPWFSDVSFKTGKRVQSRDGEEIAEEWQDGKLQRRSFRRLDNIPPGEIVVTFRGWEPTQTAPSYVDLANGWFGYRLQIRTLEQTRLP